LALRQGCQMVNFQTKNLNYGYILEGIRMEFVGIFYGHLYYITGNLVYLIM
jgi:hypothetical protein